MEKEKNENPVISIALFDILGFSNMVKQKNTQDILLLYNQLREYLREKSVAGGWVISVPHDGVWRAGATNNLVPYSYPLTINSVYFSDTFILWADISESPHGGLP